MSYWAVYKGENIVTHGTLGEIAENLEIEYSYARWLTSPSVRKRMEKGENRRVFVKVPELEKEMD